MKLPSASELQRALACPTSCVLPQIDEENEDAARGSAIDAFIGRTREVGRVAALGEIIDSELRALCDGIDIAGVPAGAEYQVSIAYDAETDLAERIHPVAFRDYPENRFCATLDLAGILDDNTVAYDDMKSGNPCAAQESMQLRAGGLFLARLMGREMARVGHLRLGWNGSWFHDRVLLDSIELEAMRNELRTFIPRLQKAYEIYACGQMPKVSYGPHCKYCRAKRGCHAIVGLVSVASSGNLSSLAKFSGATKEEMTAHCLDQFQRMELPDIGAASERIRFLQKFLSAADDAIKEIARKTPIPLSGNQELREVDRAVTVINPSIAVETLGPVVGQDVALSTIKCSQAAIEDALKLVAAKGKFSSLKRQIMAQIEDKNGISKVSIKQIRAMAKKPS